MKQSRQRLNSAGEPYTRSQVAKWCGTVTHRAIAASAAPGRYRLDSSPAATARKGSVRNQMKSDLRSIL